MKHFTTDNITWALISVLAFRAVTTLFGVGPEFNPYTFIVMGLVILWLIAKVYNRVK